MCACARVHIVSHTRISPVSNGSCHEIIDCAMPGYVPNALVILPPKFWGAPGIVIATTEDCWYPSKGYAGDEK